MKVCKRCLMDSSDKDLVIDDFGNCNHCNASIARWNSAEFQDQTNRKVQLNKWITQIKSAGQGKEYDCIIGLSGGVDSTYVAYLVKEIYGLRPLAVHLDNGWNSELAVRNIDKILDRLNIDLVTEVLDWEEFSSLQRAFLRASVIDMELLTDHAIGASLLKISKRFNVPYFISGFNFQSENIMPPTWIYPFKMDSLNIQDIYKKHGEGKRIKSFKFLSFKEFLFFGKNKMTLFPILNFVDYHKETAIEVISREIGRQFFSCWVLVLLLKIRRERIQIKFFCILNLLHPLGITAVELGYFFCNAYLLHFLVIHPNPGKKSLKKHILM